MSCFAAQTKNGQTIKILQTDISSITILILAQFNESVAPQSLHPDSELRVNDVSNIDMI